MVTSEEVPCFLFSPNRREKRAVGAVGSVAICVREKQKTDTYVEVGSRRRRKKCEGELKVQCSMAATRRATQTSLVVAALELGA